MPKILVSLLPAPPTQRRGEKKNVNFTPGLRRAQLEPQHLPQRLILHSAERLDGRHLPFTFTSQPSVRAWRPSIFLTDAVSQEAAIGILCQQYRTTVVDVFLSRGSTKPPPAVGKLRAGNQQSFPVVPSSRKTLWKKKDNAGKLEKKKHVVRH